jgi:hypothetical protein
VADVGFPYPAGMGFEHILIISLAAAVFVLLGALWLARTGTRRANHRRQRRARRGEERARRLLRRAGFRIDADQARETWWMLVDGRDVEVQVRADYLVSRFRRRYVAEVKTGELAPDPTYPPTRRQLLEYSLAFDVDGVLLVDVEEGDILEVGFPEV